MEIGGNVTGVQGDVSNLADLDRLFAQIKREKGKLDIVFANAGVAKYAPLDGASIILNASVVTEVDRKSTRLNSSHLVISYAVFCLKKKKIAINLCSSGFFHACVASTNWQERRVAVP